MMSGDRLAGVVSYNVDRRQWIPSIPSIFARGITNHVGREQLPECVHKSLLILIGKHIEIPGFELSV
jgi:hypothetical protein